MDKKFVNKRFISSAILGRVFIILAFAVIANAEGIGKGSVIHSNIMAILNGTYHSNSINVTCTSAANQVSVGNSISCDGFKLTLLAAGNGEATVLLNSTSGNAIHTKELELDSNGTRIRCITPFKREENESADTGNELSSQTENRTLITHECVVISVSSITNNSAGIKLAVVKLSHSGEVDDLEHFEEVREFKQQFNISNDIRKDTKQLERLENRE